MYIKIFGKKKKCQSSEGIKHSLKHFVKKLGNYPVSPASPFSISKSFSCTFVFILRDLVPLKQTRAVRRMAKDTFVLIHAIVVA